MSNKVPVLELPEFKSSIVLGVGILFPIICAFCGCGCICNSFIVFAIYVAGLLYFVRSIAVGGSYTPNKNLKGETIVVTGAAAGIGMDTAIELAKLGGNVIVGVRGQSRADKVAQEVKEKSGSSTVVGFHLDLSNLSTVKDFADKVQKTMQ